MLETVSSGFASLDTGAAGDGCELFAVLLVAVMNEVFRTLTPGGGFPELLRRPGVRRRGGHGRVHDSARLQFHNHKEVQWSKQQVMNHGEIAGPDVAGVVFQKGGPILA